MCLGLPIESAAPWDGIPFPWASFQGPEHNVFDLDSRLLVACSPVRDLLIFAKHLLIAATTVWHGQSSRWCSSHPSLTGHLDRGDDGVFEIVRVVGCGVVSIAQVHAIVARAHLAQSEPEMSRDRFGFLERHDAVHWRFRFLVALPPASDLLLCAKHLFVAAMVAIVLAANSEVTLRARRGLAAPQEDLAPSNKFLA